MNFLWYIIFAILGLIILLALIYFILLYKLKNLNIKLFKYKVEKAIKSINTIKASTECGYPYGYLFIKFTNNPIDDVENVKKIKNSIQELDKINKKTAKEQEKQQ